MNGGSEHHLLARFLRLERWLNITLFMLKTCRDCINSVHKSCQIYFSFMGGIWKRDIMVTHVEELREMAASEIHARRLNAKEVSTPIKVTISHLVADGTVENPWRRPESEDVHLNQGPEQEVLREASDRLSSRTPLQDDSTRDDEAKNDFWSISSNLFNITWNPESNCSCREKNSTYSDEVHQRHQNKKKTSLDVM